MGCGADSGTNRLKANPACIIGVPRRETIWTRLAPGGRPFLGGEWALAEVEDAATDGAEPGLGLQLDGIAKRRVVHARQPDADRPLALRVGLRPCLGVEFAGHALCVDLADHVV